MMNLSIEGKKRQGAPTTLLIDRGQGRSWVEIPDNERAPPPLRSVSPAEDSRGQQWHLKQDFTIQFIQRSILSYWGMSFGQLVPNAMRTVVAFCLLCQWGLSFRCLCSLAATPPNQWIRTTSASSNNSQLVPAQTEAQGLGTVAFGSCQRRAGVRGWRPFHAPQPLEWSDDDSTNFDLLKPCGK